MMMYCWNPSLAHSTERKWFGTLGWAVLITSNRWRWLRSTAPTLRNICNVQWWIQCSDKWIQLDSPFNICYVLWWIQLKQCSNCMDPVAWIPDGTFFKQLYPVEFTDNNGGSSWSRLQTIGTSCVDVPFIICNVNSEGETNPLSSFWEISPFVSERRYLHTWMKQSSGSEIWLSLTFASS